MFGKPRIVTLLEVASRAELLRRRRQVRSVALRAGLGVAGALFALFLLVWLHLTAWTALAMPLGSLGAALALCGLDLVVMVVLGSLASRSRSDPAVDEAIHIRNQALLGAELEVRTLGGLLRADSDPSPAPKRRVRVYPSV